MIVNEKPFTTILNYDCTYKDTSITCFIEL